MRISTTRFGSLDIHREDVIVFPGGVFSFEDCTDWVLLADAQTASVGWLQSVTRPEVALAIVSPKRFVPSYQLQITARELEPLRLERVRDAQVLTILNKHEEGLTLNLRAPLVINLDRRLGRQVVNKLDEPIAYPLNADAAPLRKSA